MLLSFAERFAPKMKDQKNTNAKTGGLKWKHETADMVQIYITLEVRTANLATYVSSNIMRIPSFQPDGVHTMASNIMNLSMHWNDLYEIVDVGDLQEHVDESKTSLMEWLQVFSPKLLPQPCQFIHHSPIICHS
jgi:hypothetical protein